MAWSRTHARGFQPIPSVTEKCYPERLFRRTVPEPSLAFPTVSDPSVTECDTDLVCCLQVRGRVAHEVARVFAPVILQAGFNRVKS